MTATDLSEFELDAPLCEGARHRVCRARRRATGEPVVLKILKPEAATPEERARLRHEAAILARADVPGVIRALGLEPFGPGAALVLEDVGGASLDLRAGPLPLPEFLDLAVALAGAVAGLHRRRIIHRGITPAHVVWNREAGQVRLIGFGRADATPEQTLAPQAPAALDGILACASPEQTGRMNRPVDARSDLYSLGVTFYALLTGRLPFSGDDALGLIHAHIAGVPVPPHEVEPAVPRTLSRIVRKCMAKMAEDRYQGALGLQADLERCRRELREAGRVSAFEPGEDDLPEQLRIPRRLYGRELEGARLLAAFGRIAGGARELVLVSGQAGVGKTALVQELHRAVVERQGHFLEGKSDQLQRNVPFLPWIQAFTGLASQLLMESEARLSEWRGRILDAVGSIGRVLTELIPGLELVIGAQPPMPALGAAEAQHRLSHAVRELVRAIAAERPLVVFLDDLQWADAASMDLLRALLGDVALSRLLVIGACRDAEVDAAHPLALTLEALSRDGAAVERLALDTLSEPTVNALLADTLRAPAARTRPLAALLHARTGGNPFFLRQTLASLVDRGAISVDRERRCWRWDLAALEGLEITDNVVALMVARIRQLPARTQQLLQLAACTGFQIDLGLLAVIAEASEEATREALEPALREGLVAPVGDAYQFVHDRVQQAAHELIPEADRQRVHAQIGRLLRGHLSEQEQGRRLFAVADHLNLGAELLEQVEERLDLARLDLRAGRRAKASAAFAVAARYLHAGLRLLPPAAWEQAYELALALHREAAECEYAAGNQAAADALVAEAVRHARDPVDGAVSYAIQVAVYTSQGRFAESVEVGLAALRLLGLDLPARGDPAAVTEVADRAARRCRERLARLEPGALLDAPPMTDPRACAAMELLGQMVLAAYFVGRSWYTLLVATMVELAMASGSSAAAALGYVLFAAISLSALDDFAGAAELGRVARDLIQRHRAPSLESKVLQFYCNTVAPWFVPLPAVIALQRRAFLLAMEAGALNDACNDLWGIFRSGLVGTATPLDEMLRDCDRTIAFVDRMGNAAFRDGVRFLRLPVAALQAAPDGAAPGAPPEGEAATLRHFEEMGFLTIPAHYNVFRAWTLYCLGRHDEALGYVEASRRLVACIADQPTVACHHLHRALLLLRGAPGAEQRAAASEDEARLRAFAESCPENFRHHLLLVEAERARAEGRTLEAIERYDRAIDAAAERDAWYVEGIACERAADFWQAQGRVRLAAPLVQQAHRAFARWQAWEKVRDLEARYPQWLEGAARARLGGVSGALDLDTILKATHAIAGEMEMDRLLGRVMNLVIENAGAQRGFLLRERDGGWAVVARGTAEGPAVDLPSPARPPDAEEVALGVVRYVARTRARVVQDDAAGAGEFAGEPRIRAVRVRSLLCAPLSSRGRLVGILYLENNLTTHAFTPARVQLLEVLLSQAATALENAGVYQALKESEARYRRIVDTASEGIWVLDAEGRTTFVNARMAAMLGHRAEELVGRLMTDFFAAEDLPDHRRRAENRRRGVSETYERRLRRSDGSWLWALVSATPILDEASGFQGSFGMLTDVTQRKRADRELSLLNFALNNVREAAYLIDEAGRFHFVNEEACRFLGYTREQLLTMRVSDVDPGFPADQWHVHWTEIRVRGAVVLETAHRTRDGRLVPVEVSANYFQYDGQSYDLALVRDITERKQAEAEILALNRGLEERVAQRTAALELANRELETFSYSVSHDLRAPLRAINSFAEILRRKYEPALDAEGKRYLGIVSRGAVQMGRLIDDILAFSRMSRTRMDVAEVDLKALAARVFAELRAGAPDRQIRFVLGELPPAVCDAPMIRQVLGNLIGNALKYTARRPEAVIEVSGVVQGNEHVYTVSDNGAGFDMRYAEKLFGVFQRLHRADEFEGTGIGLAIVRRIVERHGGRTWAEGEVDRGAAFHFSLPALGR